MTMAEQVQAIYNGVGKGLQVQRVFTAAGENPYDRMEWTHRTSRITNPDGSKERQERALTW